MLFLRNFLHEITQPLLLLTLICFQDIENYSNFFLMQLYNVIRTLVILFSGARKAVQISLFPMVV